MKRGMAMLSEDRERFRRFARPREVAFAAMFLASEAAAMITGTNLVIDGGGHPLTSRLLYHLTQRTGS
jgi:NAD(P)-dependent dehydrogenase (short-subunit alcohol dehydrogenase family)